MRFELLMLACVTLVCVAFWHLAHPRTVVRRQTCWVLIEKPLEVVCPDGRAYWHDVGEVTPMPGVPAS